jgi:predicted RNase H-like HicB family nuclease
MEREVETAGGARENVEQMSVALTVNIWPDEVDGGYGAECLELPGCVSQGETEHEALANVIDVIEELLASMLHERRDAQSRGADTPGRRRQVTLAISA